MNELKNKKCVPYTEGLPPMPASEIKTLSEKLPGWEVTSEGGMNHLQRIFAFPDFKQALAFTNQVGELAELEQHHPKLVTEWGKVKVVWWTHAAKGLHINDFIMAARTSELQLT